MAAGDFTASYLPNMMAEIDQVFLGDRHTNAKPVDTAQVILGRQLVDWNPFYGPKGLNNGRSCIGANVVWLKNCAPEVKDCAEDLQSCVLTGPEMESDNKLYEPNQCFDFSASVKDNKCKDLFDKATKVGKAIADGIAALDAEIQKRLIAFIVANPQDNAFTGTYGVIDGSGTPTTFTRAEWSDGRIIAELAATAEINGLHNYYGISGRNMWAEAFMARAVPAGAFNATDNQYLFSAGIFDIVFDLVNIDAANGGTPTTALVDAGAYGYFNVTDYDNDAPVPFHQGSNLSVFRVRSPRLSYNNGGTLQPVYYDVEIQEGCIVDSATNKKTTETVVRVQHQGGLHLAPDICDDGTGILIFEEEDPLAT